MYKKSRIFFVFLLSLMVSCAVPPPQEIIEKKVVDEPTLQAYEATEHVLDYFREEPEMPRFFDYTHIDTILIDHEKLAVKLFFSPRLGDIPWREDNVNLFYEMLHDSLGHEFQDYELTAITRNEPVENLIPNIFRADSSQWDSSRVAVAMPLIPAIVRPLNPLNVPIQGLLNRHIALWQSHGWYYEASLNRWEWQRARVFQTVEDLFPAAFILPYLVPMLENAGANVFMPRERDIQTHEVVLDSESEIQPGQIIFSGDWRVSGDSTGFGVGTLPYSDESRPFRNGNYHYVQAQSKASVAAEFIPDIAAAGKYAVTIAYAKIDSSVKDARVKVLHLGGVSEFLVNQQIGGGTWIYLGTFEFAAGQHPDGQVIISNASADTGYVTIDAVRFGGGMGNVARNGQVSGRPRWQEGARYYLQYAGMPDTLVYNISAEPLKDYVDDYRCRGEWVDYLKGAPFGPNKNRAAEGLGIPIDLSLGFHTDAGSAAHDTTIGTLLIYHSSGMENELVFPDSVSRLASRDFADILQTQIVEDIKVQWDPIWNRRGIWDKDYSEATRPNVPAALLELLSHHSFLDMKFGNDPRFKFSASRSIYKAMLKFLAGYHGFDYVVQPLPPKYFQALFSGDKDVTLTWQSQPDPLDSTAVAEHYIVYVREEGKAFDNGVLVDTTAAVFHELESGKIYSFKVTAVNSGGESFPSEILSVCRVNPAKPVLIVNGFDRISGPATLEAEPYHGFANFWDAGVPDKMDINFIGTQYEYDRYSYWQDDDAPGPGASHGDFEDKLIAGNSFDFPLIHGKSIRAAGRSFVSVSDEAFMDTSFNWQEYPVLDLILGEEKATPWPKSIAAPAFQAFPPALQQALADYSTAGNRLLISGAHLATDLCSNPEDSASLVFAKQVLHLRAMTDHAAQTGEVNMVTNDFLPMDLKIRFSATLNDSIYQVESPDGLVPADDDFQTIMRYAENNVSAAIAGRGTANIVLLGFPFETILDADIRDILMLQILGFLESRQINY